MVRIIIYKGFWESDEPSKHPDGLYLFGDNNVGFGNGGQAVIRDNPNAAGIPTKKYPDNSQTSFYSDSEIEDNKRHIDAAIEKIINMAENYKFVVFPKDGFGTGLAKLPERAPKTYKYLLKKIKYLKKKLREIKSIDDEDISVKLRKRGERGEILNEEKVRKRKTVVKK